jgi:hypothetical protein
MPDLEWTAEYMIESTRRLGLGEASREEIMRLCKLADKVALVSAKIPRMPSKTDEPAATFQVPL